MMGKKFRIKSHIAKKTKKNMVLWQKEEERHCTAFFLLIFFCFLAFQSISAFAKETEEAKAIQLGTSGIESPSAVWVGNTIEDDMPCYYYNPSDYIYFGMNENIPIKWRVLDAYHANDKASSGMFLLSEYVLERQVVFEKNHSEDDGDGQRYRDDWQHSDAQKWCSTFAQNTEKFTMGEQAAMLGIEKYDDSENNLWRSDWRENYLTEEEKLFFLSSREIVDYVGNYYGAPGLAATDVRGKATMWWLRSSYGNPEIYYGKVAECAGVVRAEGYIEFDNIFLGLGARPGMNLNSNTVLFISDAERGKMDFRVDENLTKVGVGGMDWKLTLIDSSRSFYVNERELETAAGDIVCLAYFGAKKGNEEYVSAMIADSSSRIVYYGRIAKDHEEGMAYITIPSDLTPGNYTLKVFSEQYNGEEGTDYASEFSDVSLLVYKNVTIQPGDTLWELSQKYNCTVAEIVSMNERLIENQDRILAGWIVKIP